MPGIGAPCDFAKSLTVVFAMVLEPANSGTVAFAMLLEAANSGAMVFAMLLEPAKSGTVAFAMLLEAANSGAMVFAMLFEPAISGTMVFAMRLEPANSGTMVFAMVLATANSGTVVFAMRCFQTPRASAAYYVCTTKNRYGALWAHAVGRLRSAGAVPPQSLLRAVHVLQQLSSEEGRPVPLQEAQLLLTLSGASSSLPQNAYVRLVWVWHQVVQPDGYVPATLQEAILHVFLGEQ